MNLREDKHWSYGSRTILVDAKGPRPFVAFAPVQTDKTAESMQELANELNQILEARPIEQDELDKVQANRILRLPGSWETSGEVSAAAWISGGRWNGCSVSPSDIRTDRSITF